MAPSLQLFSSKNSNSPPPQVSAGYPTVEYSVHVSIRGISTWVRNTFHVLNFTTSWVDTQFDSFQKRFQVGSINRHSSSFFDGFSLPFFIFANRPHSSQIDREYMPSLYLWLLPNYQIPNNPQLFSFSFSTPSPIATPLSIHPTRDLTRPIKTSRKT